MKEMNKELSRKLEAQTQRLELLTAQSMAGEIVPARLPDSRATRDEDIVLADEGDEVLSSFIYSISLLVCHLSCVQLHMFRPWFDHLGLDQ